ncbi:MAG: serine hydrolase [Chthoniobacterales bacterium]
MRPQTKQAGSSLYRSGYHFTFRPSRKAAGITLAALPLAFWIGTSIALFSVIPSITAADITSPIAAKLEGLWKAKRRFGPDARGTLIIQRNGSASTADMMGRTLPVHEEKGELAFDLPDGQGSFRGKLETKSGISGHWLRPGTTVNNSRYASAVVLKSEGANRWSGQVDPLEDDFTFYLLLQKKPDGSLSATLRNPERDLGSQLGVERLSLEGGLVKLIGQRRGKVQEAASGGYDADDGVISLNFPNRGGFYDFRREGDESDFYPRGKNPTRYTYERPLTRDDGWPTATLEEAKIDRAGMEKFIQGITEISMDTATAPQIHGVLVARHGKLVLEEYFHGEHRDKLHETRSASKSLVAVVAGAAIEAGAPLRLSSSVYQVMNGGVFPPELDLQKKAMTMEHLLTMSSGYFCDDNNDEAPGNESTMLDQTAQPDYYAYTLNVPLATPPGEQCVYCSASANLALGMVGRATGRNPLETFDRLLGNPLKINRYAWSLDPAGNPYGGGSVQMLPRDFMKFGQLMLNGGMWEGRRVLSREFAARATAPLYHLSNIYYGYLWWSEDFPYKDRTVHAFMSLGAGGQTVTVIPELDLVVAIYSGNYSSGRTVNEITHHYVPRSILPAVHTEGDAKGAPLVERAYNTPYGKSKDGSKVASPR